MNEIKNELGEMEINRSSVIGDCMVWRSSRDGFRVSRDMSEWGTPVAERTLEEATQFIADPEASVIAAQYVARCIRSGLTAGKSRGTTLGGSRHRIGCRLANDGAPTIYYEWYVEESMDDDDLSFGNGYTLPPRGGLTRVGREWTESLYDTIPPATVRAMQTVLDAEVVDPDAAALLADKRNRIKRRIFQPENFRDARVDGLTLLWTGEFGTEMYGDATRLVWRERGNTWELADSDLAAEASALDDDC